MSELILDFREIEKPRQYGFGTKLFFLYFLNVADWFCTQVLIDTGSFREANPIMAWIMRYPIVGFSIKVFLPLALSIFIWLGFKIFKLEQNRFTNFIIYSGVTIYTAVILIHIVNFVIYYAS